MLASAFIASVPVAVRTLLFTPLVIKSDTSVVMVTAPVAPETSIPVPATAEVTPELVMVTAPVAPETEMPVPATLEVTPVLVTVRVSVALAAVLIPVPPAISTVLPSEIVCEPVSPVRTQSSIVPGVDPELAAVNLPCASTVRLA